jgi:hypothetical protein
MSTIESYLSDLTVGSITVLYRHVSPPTRAELIAASEKLAARHPSLRRGILMSATGAHRFLVDASKTLDVSAHVELERLDPDDDVCPVPTNGKWLNLFNNQLHRPFHPGQPPWRIVMLTGKQAIVTFFVFNHGIGDGMSGVIAQHDLLSLVEAGSAASRSTHELTQPLAVTPELHTAFGRSWVRWLVGTLIAV